MSDKNDNHGGFPDKNDSKMNDNDNNQFNKEFFDEIELNMNDNDQ